MHRTPLPLLLASVLALQACGGSPATGVGTGALITFELCTAPGGGPQHLTIFSTRESFILEAERLVNGGDPRVPMLDLRPGKGVDPQWDWQVDPETTAFADVGPVLCDGCPADVEANLQYWLTLRFYCPSAPSVAQVVRTR